MKLRVATRRSPLARKQADTICSIIEKIHGIECEKVLMETYGDKVLDVTLSKIGGKGLFVKDIEAAMLEGKADAAVHSMKDVPFDIPEGFKIVAIPLREDVRDVFVSMNGCSFYNLPKGARVGTSSIRRSTQIKILRPDIEIVSVRGNVETRIKKIETENLDGIVLAAAGLKRLGMEEIITDYFEPEHFIPAIGQGALGVEALCSNEFINLLSKLDNYETRVCVEAERSFMRRLNGGCHTMIGAYARVEGSFINITGVFEVSGRVVKKDITGNIEDYKELGISLAEKILND